MTDQNTSTCVVCRDRIYNTTHIRLGDLIAHEYCGQYVNARTQESFAAGKLWERFGVIDWLRDHKDEHGKPSFVCGQLAASIEHGEHYHD